MIMKIDPIGNCIQDFKIKRKIGSGGFAQVFVAECLREGFKGTYVAIKKISQRAIQERNLENRVKSEIDIHSNLSNPAIVKFYTAFRDKDFVYLVLELCEWGSLEEYIKYKGQFSEKDACNLIKGIIEGIRYLHSQHILHRDLSLKNILLTKNMEIKIADFGMAVKLTHPDEKKFTMLGTANFMSPEVVRKEPYDSKADCWSVGCILYALLYGTPPFDGKGKRYTEIMKDAVMSRLTFPDYASREAKDLLSHMLEKDPKKRIDIHRALLYPFFKKYDTMKSESGQRSGDSGLSLSSSTAVSSRSTFKTYSTDESGMHSWNTDWKKRNRQSNSVPTNLHQLGSENPTGYNYSNSHGSMKYSYEQENHLPRQRKQRSKSPKQQRSYDNSRPVNQLKNKIQCLPSRQDVRGVTPSYSNSPCLNGIQRPFEERQGYQQMNMYHTEPSVNPYNMPTNPQIYSTEGSESQFHIRNRSESPAPYPACLQNLHDDKYSQSYYSVHNSVDPNLQNGALYRNNNEIPPANYPEYAATRSCSHDQYCAPDKACSHEIRCCCHYRQLASTEIRNNSYHSCNNSVKEDRNGVDLILQSLKVNESLKDIIEPLTTKRLPPKRKKTKKIIFSILDTGEVCLEILNKQEISEVCYISADGLTIQIYKPKETMSPTNEPPRQPDTVHGVQYFTFENLPKEHWNKYRYAKRFVEVIQAQTPKVTVNEDAARCMMMENTPNPNYSVEFYDGFQISQVRKKWLIIDQSGKRTEICDENDLVQYFNMNNLTFKWNEFLRMKNRCLHIEEIFIKLEETEGYSYFPANIGRRRTDLLISHDVSKQSVTPRSLHSSTLNRAFSGMKLSTMNSSVCNITQRP